ncbi:MAG: dTDP-4-dehydrorhamnose reductase [Planctomycetaceae bacterium]
MHIALIGASGQLGTALNSALAGTGTVTALTRKQIDIADAASVVETLSSLKPDTVINAAAYNFVDRAEEEPEVAFAVNGLGPRNLALYCRRHDSILVHVGSDYVFSGMSTGEGAVRDTPYRESDTPNPRSAYAVSKLAGESFVRAICSRHFVVRTCGLYGAATSPGKGNFVKTMLRLAGERDELTVVDDQRCTPTSAADLAGWIARLIGTDVYGLYHATNSGSATWCEFAREILRIAGIDVPVRPVTTAEFGAKAPRPIYSVLCCEKLETTLGVTFRPWQPALADYVQAERSRGC